MNHSSEYTDNHSHDAGVCEEMIPLLDAYRTDELEENEKEKVRSHLETCSLCQKLFEDIQEMSVAYTKVSLVADKNVAEKPDAQLVENIMAKILSQQEHNQELLPFAPIKHVSPPRSRERSYRLRYYLALACAAVFITSAIFVCSGIVQYLNSYQARGTSGVSVTGTVSRPRWELASNQMFLREDQDVFGIEYIETNAHEILFVYVTTHHAQGSTQIQATSSLVSNSSNGTVLPSYIQKLGHLGNYDVNILHIRRFDRVGQFIRLKITFPDKDASSGYLQPIKQLLIDSPEGSLNVDINQKMIPEVLWSRVVGTFTYALLQGSNAQGSNATYIFLRQDLAGNFYTITKEEYLKTCHCTLDQQLQGKK